MPFDANAHPDEWYEDVGEWLAKQVADDDGMAQPYIRLEDIGRPRMLSWAEERALRKDLEDWAAGQGRIVRGPVHRFNWSGIFRSEP